MVANHAWRMVRPPLDTWWSHTLARVVTFLVLSVVLVFHRAPTTDAALRVLGGMVNLPAPWHDPLGPLGTALAWIGIRFEGEPISAAQLGLIPWLLLWIAFMWFAPNTQQLLARWHPAFNYGVAERQRDP